MLKRVSGELNVYSAIRGESALASLSKICYLHHLHRLVQKYNLQILHFCLSTYFSVLHNNASHLIACLLSSHSACNNLMSNNFFVMLKYVMPKME